MTLLFSCPRAVRLDNRRICKALVVYLCVSTGGVAQERPDDGALLLEEAFEAIHAVEGDHARAFPVVEKAAIGGDGKAQYALCNAYRFGIGVPADQALAFGWCLKAGEQGESQAQYSIGEICSGTGRDASDVIAATWYRKAAEQGLARAQFALARAYERAFPGPVADKDLAAESILDWYRESAGQGNAQAQFRLGTAYENGHLGLMPDESTALEWLLKAAEQDLAMAQVRLGDKSAEGSGVPQDLPRAYGWYLRAIDSSEKDDENRLQGTTSRAYDGLGNLAGRGFAPAAETVRTAAEQGMTPAQRSLAHMYAKGQGAGGNFEKAYQWYGRLEEKNQDMAITGFRELAEQGFAPALGRIRGLAAQGNARAQLELGIMHADGLGVAADGSEAAEWWFLAAEQGNVPALDKLRIGTYNGDAEALKRLAVLAQQGSPGAQMMISIQAMAEDSDAANAWLRHAAQEGQSWAQAGLGLGYFFGMDGLKRDLKASLEWTRKAAEQGIAMSQLALGFMHFTGEAVSRDMVQAYAWLRAGAEHALKGEVSVLVELMDLNTRETGAMIEELNDRAARILGPERLVEAKQLAREYRQRFVYPYQCGLLPDLDPDRPELTFSFSFERRDESIHADDGENGEDFVELGRQVVTGSRIRRIDVEQARPVVVITREDIELSGRESVADVLRNNPVNSFGSSRERSGNAWIGQATVNLHGIGANRTLVLLDGRRMPRSPVTANQAVDLNIIPLAAVERVEILTDSASAIYGSDAIGGVVNIILRKNYEGIEVATSLDRPIREGADAESAVLTLGGATDRGRFLFSADFHNKEHIASADRFYTLGTKGYGGGAAEYPSAPFPATWYAWENADNVSSWGNTLWPHYLAAPNCEQVADPAGGNRILAGPYIAQNGEEYCGFHYATTAWETTDLRRASVFLHADYELTPDHALRLQSLFSTQDVLGRFAPPPGDITLTREAAAGIERGFDFDVPYPELLPYTLRHRFVGMGDRNFEALLRLNEHALLAYGTVGMFDYELEARHTRYDGREDSCCFPKAFTTSQLIAQGRYNPFDSLNPDNAAGLAAIAASSTRHSRADFRSYSGNVNFDLFQAPFGPLSWAIGFDYFDEHYRDLYDPLSAGGDLLGRAGVNGAGERVIKALFGETLVPLMPNLEVSAALRWDEYDDGAGSEISSYLSARYQPTGWLLLRASWGEGFRAGSMNNLYDGTSLWLQTSFDLVRCRRDGIAPSECTEGEFPTYTGGNRALRPELSESYNLGAVVAWNSLTARVDYWNVDLENGIALPPLQGLIAQEFEGQCLNTGRIEPTRYTGTPAEIVLCNSGSFLKRDPATGALLEADVFWDNTHRAQFRGLDFLLSYDLDTRYLGSIHFALHAGVILQARARARYAAQWSSGIGTASGTAAAAGARPSDRSSASVHWRYGNHTLSTYVHHVGGFGVPEAEFSISPHTEVDLFYQWEAPWNGRVTLGVKNLSDKDPELGSFSSPLPQAYELYSLDGRILYASYRHRF